ncbi:MAG: hypothetical protein LBQ18_00740 [Campylobacteraceae bacterium]|jgi:hypothetical protein|nr:hypothetical protein [Campylobacteraceae bacterium]
MNKFISLGLLGVVALSFTACSDSKEEQLKEQIRRSEAWKDEALVTMALSDISSAISESSEWYRTKRKLDKVVNSRKGRFESSFMSGDGGMFSLPIEGDAVDVSNGGVVHYQTLIKRGNNKKENCLTFTYEKEGKLHVKGTEKPKGDICRQLLETEQLQRMITTYNLAKR